MRYFHKVGGAEPTVQLSLHMPVRTHNAILADVSSGVFPNKTRAILSILENHYAASSGEPVSVVPVTQLEELADTISQTLTETKLLLNDLGDIDVKAVKDFREALHSLVAATGNSLPEKDPNVGRIDNLNKIYGKVTQLHNKVDNMRASVDRIDTLIERQKNPN